MRWVENVKAPLGRKAAFTSLSIVERQQNNGDKLPNSE